jgi:hypothetical protein
VMSARMQELPIINCKTICLHSESKHRLNHNTGESWEVQSIQTFKHWRKMHSSHYIDVVGIAEQSEDSYTSANDHEPLDQLHFLSLAWPTPQSGIEESNVRSS